MQALDLNLATRPFKNDTLLWSGLCLAVALIGWASLWNTQTWLEHRALLSTLRETETSLRNRAADLERRDEQARGGIAKYEIPVVKLKAEKANEIIRWKAFSWTRLFNQLEHVLPGNVEMSSVRPVFRGETARTRNSVEDPALVPVSVDGASKDLRDMLEFERNLIRDPHFDVVEPESWATDEQTNETVFRMRFLYDPRVGAEDGDKPDESEKAEDPRADADEAGVEAGAAGEGEEDGGGASAAPRDQAREVKPEGPPAGLASETPPAQPPHKRRPGQPKPERLRKKAAAAAEPLAAPGPSAERGPDPEAEAPAAAKPWGFAQPAEDPDEDGGRP